MKKYNVRYEFQPIMAKTQPLDIWDLGMFRATNFDTAKDAALQTVSFSEPDLLAKMKHYREHLVVERVK